MTPDAWTAASFGESGDVYYHGVYGEYDAADDASQEELGGFAMSILSGDRACDALDRNDILPYAEVYKRAEPLLRDFPEEGEDRKGYAIYASLLEGGSMLIGPFASTEEAWLVADESPYIGSYVTVAMTLPSPEFCRELDEEASLKRESKRIISAENHPETLLTPDEYVQFARENPDRMFVAVQHNSSVARLAPDGYRVAWELESGWFVVPISEPEGDLMRLGFSSTDAMKNGVEKAIKKVGLERTDKAVVK